MPSVPTTTGPAAPWSGRQGTGSRGREEGSEGHGGEIATMPAETFLRNAQFWFMPRISDIAGLLEAIAPPALQEDYDNSGLLVGEPDTEVTGVLVSLDVTEAVVAEAQGLQPDRVAPPAHFPCDEAVDGAGRGGTHRDGRLARRHRPLCHPHQPGQCGPRGQCHDGRQTRLGRLRNVASGSERLGQGGDLRAGSRPGWVTRRHVRRRGWKLGRL